jgi:hypothetical protein
MEYYLREMNFRDNEVTLNFSMDGLPLGRSTSLKLWPISMTTSDRPKLVHIVAVWFGNREPTANELLDEFIKELNNFLLHGFKRDEDVIKVKVGFFTADLPAMARIRCHQQASGYACCYKCDCQGIHHGRILFPPAMADAAHARTDAKFRQFVNEQHHQHIRGTHVESPFTRKCSIKYNLQHAIV